MSVSPIEHFMNFVDHLGVKLSTLHATWINLRYGWELTQARHLWVQENLWHRAKLRSEVMAEAA